MTKGEIYAMFTEILAEQFEIERERIHPGARLVADFDLDSLDRVALGAEIEAKCGIALEDNDVRDCETVGDLIDRFAAQVAERVP